MRRRQFLAGREGGEEGRAAGVGALRQVLEGAAVGRDHPPLFQGEARERPYGCLAAFHERNDGVGRRVRGERSGGRAQQFPGPTRHGVLPHLDVALVTRAWHGIPGLE
ncbi:hypothetical protein GCM10010339_27210 [Streptomyces alanosinicus]|uniref:Uncharacterized protein n=1 Tax=Streptomyces alanosinicus TaxID=68171 RepID=A0A918YG58_9ACTN|nr:hypothetical protein GCM10010339_27210 [Streptomyces alanosinicus]